jgi:hypothetical protein
MADAERGVIEKEPAKTALAPDGRTDRSRSLELV